MSVVANVAINIDGKQAQSLLKAIQSEVEKLNGSFDDLEPKPKSFGQKIKDFAQSAVGQLAAVTGAAFTLQQALKTLGDQSKAEAALRTLGVDAEAASRQFAQLSKNLQGQASTVELTAAAYDVASAGFTKVADQTKILEAATKGAVGGMSDINTVGNAVTSVLNAYGMSADQAASLVDGFIQTQNDGKIVLGEYAALIGRLAPTAAAAGVGIKELNAAVATITAQGVAPETAITGLNQALVSILKPTSEATKLSQQLGIDFNEAGLRSKGLAGFLEQVAKATGGSASKLTTLFGSVDALKAILPLLSGDMQKFVENILKQDKAAGVASAAFNEMSATLEGALKEVDTAFKNLVVSFKPVVPAIVAPFKLLAGVINVVANNLKAFAQTAVFVGTFVGVLKAAVIATKLWAIATQGLAMAKKAAGVAAAFLQAVMNPVNIAKIALALGVATGAAVALGNSMGQAGNKAEAAKGKQGEIATETAKINEEINKQLKGLDQIPPKQQAHSAAAQETLDTLQKQKTTIDAQTSSLDRGASVNSARYEAEKAINNLQGKQQERQHGLAQAAQEQLNIVMAISQQQAQAALAQDSVTEAANKNATAQQQIAQYQMQTAAAQLESKTLAAQTALEQKSVSDKIGLSQTSAVSLSNNLAAGAMQANALASGTQQVSTNAASAEGNFNRVATAAEQAAGSIMNAANAQARLNALQGGGGGGRSNPPQRAADGAYWAGGFQAFAKGGIVTKPTLGLIGEGGEPEYIVPKSKAADFAANYLSGARGSAAIPSSTANVSIQTGPVTQMNGTNYVTTQDMSRAVQAGVQQTLNLLRNDIGVRGGMGIA